jgi:hypothetical protein
MTPSPRHTETLAIECLYGTGEHDPGYLNNLLTLTAGEPTTEEIQEALQLISREIPAVLRAWISSRRIIDGRRTMTGPRAAALATALNAIPVASPEEDEALDAVPVYAPVDREQLRRDEAGLINSMLASVKPA